MAEKTATAPAATNGLSTTTMVLIALGIVTLGGIFLYPMIKAALQPSPQVGSETGGKPELTGNELNNARPAPVTGAPTGNDFVSGEAINKVVLGNYNKWVDLGLSESNRTADMKIPAKAAKWNQYNSFWGKINELFGDPNQENREPLIAGFLKGMNLAQSATNVAVFRTYIQEYLDNPTHMFHWEITKPGQFLGK